jgi:tRNA dimethylallyltransferase
LSIESKNKQPVILLFGPTAVGKTSLIEQLFSTHFEVINADSRQVYRYLDIGTAKPSTDLRRRIPHHLIDLLEPTEHFDLGYFVKKADSLIPEILGRNHLPVLSGGTAFYLYHFIFGLPEAPASDEAVRASLADRLQREGRAGLWRELEQSDPETAGKLHPNDTQRLLRALEVYQLTGSPLSGFKASGKARDEYRFLLLGLNRDRSELYRRIDRRVDEMWEAGLPEEFRSLVRRGFREDDPGMKGIGYREFFPMLKTGEMDDSRVREEIKKNSRRYAKRQITFFRRIPGVEWYHPDQGEAMRARVRKFCDENPINVS